MSKRILVAASCVCVLYLIAGLAHAQQLDVAFGFHALTAPAASSASGNYFPQSLRGGLYPSFSGDVLFFKNQIGINADVSLRASRSLYQSFQPFRPIFYDFNGIWAPRLTKSLQGELMAGIGAESLRFYQSFYTCNFTGCTNYVSSNHFLGHFAGGLRYYLWGNLFLRPEAHLYLVRHNFEFSSARATRFGMSIGYTIGSR